MGDTPSRDFTDRAIPTVITNNPAVYMASRRDRFPFIDFLFRLSFALVSTLAAHCSSALPSSAMRTYALASVTSCASSSITAMTSAICVLASSGFSSSAP